MDIATYIKDYIPAVCSLIAAFSAIYCSILTAKRQKENLYSKIVLDHVKPVMSAYYRCVSIAHVINTRINNNESVEQYRDRGNEDIEFIKKEKDSLRYIIGEGTDGLRVLTRLKSFIYHKIDDKKSREDLIKLATLLRKALDNSFIYAINNGRKPSQKHIDEIIKITNEIYKTFNTTQNADEISEVDEVSPSSISED